MPMLIELPDPFLLNRMFYIWDDFCGTIVTADLWTTLVADVLDGGATAIATTDGAGGRVSISPQDATDNDEVSLESTRECFLFADDKPLIFEASCQYTEAATDDANIYIGLMNAVGANSMQDNGAGPAASYSGVNFHKVDGGTRWQAESSIATTLITTDLTAANSLDGVLKTAGRAAYQVFRIEFKPYSTTNAYVDFFIDGVHVAHHDFVYTSATEMQIGFIVKNGGAAAETMLVDYVFCGQLR